MKTKQLSLAFLLPLLWLGGCNGSSGNGNPPIDSEPGTDPSAPYSYSKYQQVLGQSSLQVSDTEDELGNSETLVGEGEFADYYSDHFYYDLESDSLAFKMRGYSNRSAISVEEHFDVSELGVENTLSASILPVNVESSLANTPADKDVISYLQIHNHGTDASGNGAIPHPLLRIVYDQERNGLIGHYWAVLKKNTTDCTVISQENTADCMDAYEYIDLGEADLEQATRFQLTVRENTLTISVGHDLIIERDISYWADLLSYFQSGLYNQFENGEAQVLFPRLSVARSEYEADKDWNINHWKITIPASKDDWYSTGGTSAAELEPSHCDSSSKDVLSNDSFLWFAPADVAFFKVDDGRMHFSANMGYGTTTENSSYIRSELRELFNAQQLHTCSTSSSDTSWSINDRATGTTTHRLQSTLMIEQYPAIDGQLPKVVVGQVHGWKIKQALVKVVWEGEDKPVRVILNQDFYQNNQSCSVNTPAYPECEEWPFSVNMGTYAANQDWQYDIRVDDVGIWLETQYADGSHHRSHHIKWGEPYANTNNGVVTMSNNWNDEDVAYYFKAGIYPQFKPKPDYFGELFEVSFSEMTVQHQ